MSSCKFLEKVKYVTPEIGGGTVSSEMWNCQLGLNHIGMDWARCQQTSYRGPCWQMTGQFQTVEDWEVWAKRQLNRL